MKINNLLLLLFYIITKVISQCPSPFNGNNLIGPSPESKCYTFISTSRNYNSAVSNCNNIGMRSPVINSDDENNYILNNFNFDKIWIGLNDISVEKTFRWSWGDQITQYQTWESGEPNNKDNEDCVQLIKSSRKWNDEGCGDSFQSICAICKLGTYFDGKVCVSCPGGTFANYLNTEDHCSRCPSGYVSSSGSLSCTQCNRGTYANSDQTACISCPPGTISDVGSTSSNQCSSCSDGYYVRDTYCVSCAPSGADPTRFIGGGASSDSCRCRSPWAGPRCDITECPGRLSGLSLGGLYLQSIPDLKNYSKSFSTTTIETNQAVRDLLENIFYVIVDLDGDEVITKTEMLASLSSKGITNTSLTTFPLWCSTYTVQSCFSDSYDCASFINDAYNNYIYTQSHEFDSSSLSVLNSFYASFPDSTWSDSQCSNNRNREVSVQWTFKPNRPALYRVCGYTNGFLDPSFGGANIISGSVTSFNDINPITSIIGFKRIYCVEVSYCADSSSSSYCSPTTPGFTTGISCTVGLRYDYTPIDLVPFLAENGVSFTYMDTAATETRFDIFFGRNGAASTHMVSVPYPADGCGRISTPISFTDRINADLVGRNLVYGVRAVLPTGPTSLTTTNYRIPFIGTITGSVKTSTGAPVKDVTITLCHIDPNTGDDDTISTYCPLTDTKTDQRGLYSIDVRVSSYRWNSTTEQFRIIASYIEIIDGEELVHTFSPADQIITLKHRYSSLANFVDETSVTIRGNVKFHPDLVAGELCPFEGVTIFLNSTTGISNTTTDSSGNFLFSISRTDSATVYIPSGWNGHSWIVNASLSSLNLPSPKISSKTYLNFAAPDFSTTRRQLQTTTLVAQYPLDGNANDVSGNGNHGTLSSVTFTTDRFGVSNSAASFGSSGAVILPSIAASGNAARSMTAWVKTSSTSDQAIIVTGTTVTSQGFNLLLLSSGSRFTVSGYSYDFTPTDCPNINDNIWHHLAATFDGTTLNMYVDGNLCGSTTRTYETSGQSNSLSKSSSSGTGSGLGVKSFLGSMDDVRFYTGALTTSQVGGIYTESTYSPSISPTFIPSRPPTRSPTRSPSRLPTLFPTRQPSVIPTLQPTTEPTIEPTIEPSVEPSIEPTIEPTIAPTVEPTLLPTRLPTRFPTRSPTRSPTRPPTVLPTRPPTVEPTLLPTVEPTLLPTMEPTFTPTISFSPTRSPTRLPTTLPTRIPSVLPTFVPTFAPTTLPTRVPSVLPTFVPTFAPTTAPTRSPTIPPSRIPTRSPTFAPSNIPTFSPSTSPTFTPTFLPSNSPTFRPSSPPTLSPTKFYSSNDIALLHDYDFFDNQDSIGNSILQTTGTVSIFEGFATFLGLSNSYITIPDRPLREASAVTFELWVDIAPTNDVNSVLFSFGPSSNSFSYKSNHQGVSQYIAVVLSNSNGVTRGKVYINGVLVSTRDVIESSLLGGFIANNDIPGYLGRDVTGTSPPFTGTFKTFRIWWGELSPTTIYSNSAIDGVEQQAIKLTSQMTKADVQINFFFTSKQNIQIGFYGAADNKVKMFNDNVKFDIKATTCPFKIIGRLDADGNEYIGSIPALNYTVTMNSFTYTFPNFQLPTTPLFGEPICADNLQPYDYIEKTNQLNQDLIIPSVISDRYSIEYYYRSGVCVYFDNAINFNTLQQPIAPPPSATPAFQNEACYPKSITVLKEEVPYNITIFIFERYPMSASNGRVVLGTNLSDATIYITDDVSAKNERLIIPFVGDSKSELTPLANLTGYRYTLNPKNPFPVSPFYLKFEITVEKPITQLLTNRITQTWYIPVTGVLTNPFSTFIPVATDPTLIFLVLRDPPGGGSYTTIESGTSIEFSMSLEGMYTFDHGQSWDFNLGAGIFNDFTVPLVGTKLTDVETILLGGGASLGSTLTTTRGSSTHYQYSFEFTSSFSTSQSPNDAGHGSDIIIGGGVDLIVLEGLAVKKREINNYVCFHSESSRIWSPGKVTTFVLAVREIELTINKLTYIASTETNVTIQRQLNKQITNWQTVLSNYRDHNEDLTNIFHADEMLLNQEINNFAETLQIKAQSMEFDTRYDSRLNGDGFSDLDGKLNEMKYNIQSKCGQLESYSVATSMCNQFDNNNWNTVSKAIQNGACELIIPNQDEGKLKYNTITTTSSGKGGNANQYTKQVFAGYTKASPTSLKDLTILQQFCLQRQATISGIPGGAIINAKNSIFGFLEDNNKLVTFGSGTETSFSYTSTVTNAISLSSGFSYQFDTSGGIYTDLKLGVGAVLIKGGSSTMFSHDRDLSTNVDVDSNRLTKRTVTVTLFDPDPNDYFAVRISSDPTYGTPVFTTMGGQSSCPAETATLARESGVSIIDIIPRCGEFGAAGACTSLPTGTTAHFTVRIVNLSPTRDDVIYTLGFDSLFDEAPLEATSSYQLCNNLNPKEGQRSGLIASFSTTQLTNLPYGIPVEILVSIDNKGPCKNYRQVRFRIQSECETVYKYQYQAIRNTKTGNINILYNQTAPRLSDTRGFDVSWQYSTTTQQFSSGGDDSSTNISSNISFSFLIIILIFLILSSILQISIFWFLQHQLTEIRASNPASPQQSNSSKSFYFSGSYRSTDDGLSVPQLEISNEENPNSVNQEILDQESLTPTTKVMSQI